jgi:hypothetical protein
MELNKKFIGSIIQSITIYNQTSSTQFHSYWRRKWILKLKCSVISSFIFKQFFHTVGISSILLSGKQNECDRMMDSELFWMKKCLYSNLHSRLVQEIRCSQPCHSWGIWSLASSCCGLSLIPDKIIWDLWWTKQH